MYFISSHRKRRDSTGLHTLFNIFSIKVDTYADNIYQSSTRDVILVGLFRKKECFKTNDSSMCAIKPPHIRGRNTWGCLARTITSRLQKGDHLIKTDQTQYDRERSSADSASRVHTSRDRVFTLCVARVRDASRRRRTREKRRSLPKERSSNNERYYDH